MRPLSCEEVPGVVDAELRRAVPSTWRVERKGRTRWEVIPDAVAAEAACSPLRSYEVHALGHDVVVTHGNTDAGALTVERLARAATMIRVEVHPICAITLADCLRHVFARNAPNVYGFT